MSRAVSRTLHRSSHALAHLSHAIYVLVFAADDETATLMESTIGVGA